MKIKKVRLFTFYTLFIFFSVASFTKIIYSANHNLYTDISVHINTNSPISESSLYYTLLTNRLTKGSETKPTYIKIPFSSVLIAPTLFGNVLSNTWSSLEIDTNNFTHDQRLMITARDEAKREIREELMERDLEYRLERESLAERDALLQQKIRLKNKSNFIAEFSEFSDNAIGFSEIVNAGFDHHLTNVFFNLDTGSQIIQEMKDIFQEENTFVLVEYVDIPASTNSNDTNISKTVTAVTNKVALTEEEHEIIQDDFLVFDTMDMLLAEKEANKKTNKVVTHASNTNQFDTVQTNLIVDKTQINEVDEEDEEEEEQDSLSSLKELIRQTKGFGYLSINIARNINKYRLFLNGKYMDTLDYNNNYESEVIGGETYDIVLIENDSSEQVFQKVVTVERDKTNRIDYIPTGTLKLTIKYLKTPSYIKIDGAITDVTTNSIESYHEIPLEAYETYKVDIVTTNEELLLTRKIVDIEEAKEEKLRLRLGSKNRKLFFWAKGLEGGPSAQIGFDFKLHERHRIDLYAGAIFTDPLVLKGDIEYTWFFLVPKDSFFRMGLTLFTTHFYTFEGNAIYSFSPGAGLTFGFNKFHIFIKGRYSLVEGSEGFVPVVGLGLLF